MIPFRGLHFHDDSDYDGSPVADIKVPGKSLDEHHRRHDNDSCT